MRRLIALLTTVYAQATAGAQAPAVVNECKAPQVWMTSDTVVLASLGVRVPIPKGWPYVTPPNSTYLLTTGWPGPFGPDLELKVGRVPRGTWRDYTSKGRPIASCVVLAANGRDTAELVYRNFSPARPDQAAFFSVRRFIRTDEAHDVEVHFTAFVERMSSDSLDLPLVVVNAVKFRRP
jgi:hypothetical protein